MTQQHNLQSRHAFQINVTLVNGTALSENVITFFLSQYVVMMVFLAWRQPFCCVCCTFKSLWRACPTKILPCTIWATSFWTVLKSSPVDGSKCLYHKMHKEMFWRIPVHFYINAQGYLLYSWNALNKDKRILYQFNIKCRILKSSCSIKQVITWWPA